MYTYDPYLKADPLSIARNRYLKRVSDPMSEPVTLNEAKLYARINTDDDDSLIEDLIVSTRMTAEDWLRRSLIHQEWKLAYDYVVPQSVWLPMGPVDSISSVVLVSLDGTTQAMDSNAYWLNAARNAIVFSAPITAFRVEISYLAGYGSDASLVPKPIKQGLLSHIAYLYDNRGEAGDIQLPEQVISLYLPFREVRL